MKQGVALARMLLLSLAACTSSAREAPILKDSSASPGPSEPGVVEDVEDKELPPPLTPPGVPIATCPARSGKSIVLTFDDGPGPHTDALLDHLDEKGVKAAFFLKADTLDEGDPAHLQNRLRLQRIQAAGHEVCNHSYSHRDLTTLDDEAMEKEIVGAEDLIASITGRRTRCLRPPYSKHDARVDGILGKLDYRMIMTSLDSWDWLYASTEFPAEFDPAKVMEHVKAGAAFQGPLIHLQHDNEYTKASVDLVPDVVDHLRQTGWEIITLRECLGGRIDVPAK